MYYNVTLEVRTSMTTNFDTTVNMNDSMFSAQSEDLDKTIEVLEESKDDLKSDWMKENFEQTIRALEEKRAMQ